MSISNINITTVNGTNIYAVKAPIVPAGYDYEQCSPSQATGVAILRYSPSVAEVVEGEYYANSSELIKYIPFTIEYNYISVDYINIYIKKHSDVTWLLYGKELPASGQSTFALLPSDFIAGDDIDVKIEDSANATVIDIIENQHIYVTMSITSYPTSTRLATNFTVSGKANLPDGSEITVRLTSIEGGLKERTAIVSSGAWSITDYQLLVADGFLPNQNISILAYYIDEVIDFKSETDAFGTIATFNLNAIGNQTAGVAFNVAGTTDLPDGAEVEVFADATSKGTAVVASGAFTKSVTIADPANDVIMKVQDKLNANANDTETIDVASAYTEAAIMLASVTTSATETLQYSSNSGANWSAKGTQTRYDGLAMSEDGKYGLAVINGTKSYLIIEGTYSETSIGVNKSYNDCAVSKSGQYMMMAHDDGIYVSINYGTGWTNYKSGIAIKCCCMSETGDKMYGFATNGRVWVSTDYGSNWTSRDTADRGWDQCVCSKNADYVYGRVAGTAYAYKFTNNGATVATIGPASKQWLDISCSGNGDKIMLCNFVDAVYYSSDYGANFGTVGSASGFRKCKISGDGNYAVKYTSSGYTLSVAQTPFTSWTNIATKSYSNLWISYSGQYMLAPVSGASGEVSKSSNYGATWASVGLGTYNWNIAIGNTKR